MKVLMKSNYFVNKISYNVFAAKIEVIPLGSKDGFTSLISTPT